MWTNYPYVQQQEKVYAYSRKVWVYFLVEKLEAFIAFKKYKNYVEKEAGSSIRCRHTDHGGEFTSLEFTKFCSENGT